MLLLIHIGVKLNPQGVGALHLVAPRRPTRRFSTRPAGIRAVIDPLPARPTKNWTKDTTATRTLRPRFNERVPPPEQTASVAVGPNVGPAGAPCERIYGSPECGAPSEERAERLCSSEVAAEWPF